MAASSRKFCEATEADAAGVVFLFVLNRKTTPSARLVDASRHFLTRASTPPCGDARRGISPASNSSTLRASAYRYRFRVLQHPQEEGTLRPLNKCLATLNRAQRGRSERCCNSCLTSPAAPSLSNVAFGLIGAASPPRRPRRRGIKSLHGPSNSFVIRPFGPPSPKGRRPRTILSARLHRSGRRPPLQFPMHQGFCPFFTQIESFGTRLSLECSFHELSILPLLLRWPPSV